MKTISLLCLALLLELSASENIFFPAQGNVNNNLVKKEYKNSSPLDKLSIKLPSSAKSIRKVTIEYQNADGSYDEYIVSSKNSINSAKPLYLSQNEYRKGGSKKYKKLGSSKDLAFYASGQTLKIKSKSTILKTFALNKPFRLVLDFKRETPLANIMKWTPSSVFKRIKVGNHKGYYRTVIELDKRYKYTRTKTSDGYIIVFK